MARVHRAQNYGKRALAMDIEVENRWMLVAVHYSCASVGHNRVIEISRFGSHSVCVAALRFIRFARFLRIESNRKVLAMARDESMVRVTDRSISHTMNTEPHQGTSAPFACTTDFSSLDKMIDLNWRLDFFFIWFYFFLTRWPYWNR